jgi:ribulose-phosphate 3-epimerase
MGYSAGFAGSKFERSVLEKPAQVRAIVPGMEIGLDGGVNDKTISVIAKAEFDVINVNSFLFDNPNMDTLSAYSVLMEKTL